MNASEIKNILYNKTMNSFQIFAASICIFISFVDGFDVLMIAQVAPIISKEWSLTSEQVGVIFSSGLLGMVFGALFLAPLADKFGRRNIILSCLIILTVGMFCSGISKEYGEMIFWRILTGIGMGAVLPSINTIISEYSSNKHRSLLISIMIGNFTAAGLFTGLISIYLIQWFGWQCLFFVGSALSLIVIPVMYFKLPESLDFILTQEKNDKNLRKLNDILMKLDLNICSQFPDAPIKTNNSTNSKLSLLLSPQILKSIILLCSGIFMLMFSQYFMINWSPKILVNTGYSNDLGSVSTMLLSVFGLLGGLSLGWFASKNFSLQKTVAASMIFAFFVMALSGMILEKVYVYLFFHSVSGFLLFSAMSGCYALAPLVFPSEIRATGTGIVLGLARFGAVLGPYSAGVLINAQFSSFSYFFILSIPLLVAALCIFIIKEYKE